MIVNADDFGLSPEMNRAILDAFDQGLCTSTTIAANMPGFEQACQAAHDRRLLDCVGVHLVLSEGEPLTEPIKRCPRFCDGGGRLCLDRARHVFRLSRTESDAVTGELAAQIARCRRHGLPLTHADSHKHAHEEWPIATIVMDLCRREGIGYLRLARNCGPQRSRLVAGYRRMVNRRIRRSLLAATRYFGSKADYDHLLATGRAGADAAGSIEIMCHPGYDRAGALVDLTPDNPIQPMSAFRDLARQATSYGRLGRAAD